MKMMHNITTKLAAHYVRMDEITSHVIILGVVADVQPGPSRNTAKRDHPRIAVPDDQDMFHVMEKQVHCRVAEHLSKALPAYLPTTDEDT